MYNLKLSQLNNLKDLAGEAKLYVKNSIPNYMFDNEDIDIFKVHDYMDYIQELVLTDGYITGEDLELIREPGEELEVYQEQFGTTLLGDSKFLKNRETPLPGYYSLEDTTKNYYLSLFSTKLDQLVLKTCIFWINGEFVTDYNYLVFLPRNSL